MITPQEMKVAERVGRRAASRWKAAEQDDVISHLYLWIAENSKTIERWRSEEAGDKKLFVTLRREAAKFCAHEQQVQVGRPIRQENFYSIDLLIRALPYVFEDVPVSTAVENPVTGQTYVSGTSADFGNAAAIMADIKGAFYGLNKEIREVLELRFRDGLTYEEIGELDSISKVGAKKRVDRAVERLRDGLSGDRI
ncbi:RNA polymerase sigma-70 region 4 [uncultured Caudovirales phage]|uniref:RNA polymerase sigma-70 region 4 n=1 Tax=uncultured Caudovirales phage TaxID=2100421 RepID=A0A6J5N421_9CAUD|nr:RNA polymerase sigma-70 region 4 [uncultured Caudovirales phage]